MFSKYIFQIIVVASFALLDATVAQDFRSQQKKFPRVKTAYQEKELSLKHLSSQRGLPYPPQAIYIRIFKMDRILELWVQTAERDSFKLLKEYRICATSGDVGPKRKQGDGQIPEGFYG